MSGSGWGPPAGAGPDSGWDDQPRSGWGHDGSGSTANHDEPSFSPVHPAPLTNLYLALGSASFGLLVGAALLFLAPRATTLTAITAGLAWLLSGVVTVLAVAAHQQVELQRAVSAYYVANPSAVVLRLAALGLGTLGVIVTSYYFADWLARR